MNKYTLREDGDGNSETELKAQTFQEAIEESLNSIGWYVMDEGEYHIAVKSSDPNDTFELSEQIFEDAQYETLAQLGYYITSPV